MSDFLKFWRDTSKPVPDKPNKECNGETAHLCDCKAFYRYYVELKFILDMGET